MMAEKSMIGHIYILSFLIVFFCGNLTGCIETQDEIYITGNIGNVRVSGETSMVRIDDYLFETMVYNDSEKSVDKKAGIFYNEDTISYKVIGNATNIAGKELSKVTITVRFFGGVSKGVFILNSDSQVKNYIDHNETWNFVIRFNHNEKNFGGIDFIDIFISTEN